MLAGDLYIPVKAAVKTTAAFLLWQEASPLSCPRHRRGLLSRKNRDFPFSHVFVFGSALLEKWNLLMIGPDWKTLQVQSGKNLPHWSCRNAIYHVCSRLADSIPGEKAEQLQRKKEVTVNSSAYRNRKLTLDEKEWLRHLHTEELEKLLNAGYGNCYLRRPEIAGIVKDSKGTDSYGSMNHMIAS